MKGQMFILTMVFLAGLVFTIQASLSSYAFIDLAGSFDNNEAYILKNLETSFNQTVAGSLTCLEALENLEELKTFTNNRVIRGTSVSVDYSSECSNWGTADPAITVTIKLKSVSIDTTERLQF